MFRRRLFWLSVLAGLVLVTGCVVSAPRRARSSALEFLYPSGRTAAEPAKEVTLRLPVRVGLAFAPSSSPLAGPISELQKQTLLDSVAEAFKTAKGVGKLEVVPSTYLEPRGGFENLDRLAASLGLDLMVLLSYDQTQFTESTRASWSYLTVVGPLFVDGEKNETLTLMDAVVYDIPSRALLFRAAGESSVKSKSNPFTQSRKQRKLAEQGFDLATEDLIVQLNEALQAFEEQAKTGTVRGQGTPAIAMYDASGTPVGGGGGGAGALGTLDLLAAALLGLAFLRTRRRPA